MKLLTDEALERSAVVANCGMNRERKLVGSNGYTKELGFNPVDFLEGRVDRHDRVAWLDLRCGTGKALVELAYRYGGADDRAGPNYTGQPTVNSHYEYVR